MTWKIPWSSFPVLNVTEAFYCEVLECTWWQALENNIIFFQVHLSGRWCLQNPRSRAEPPLKISCNCPSIWKGDNNYISVTLESWLFGLASQINVKGKWNIMHPKAKICNCTQSVVNAQKDGQRHWFKSLTQFQNRTVHYIVLWRARSPTVRCWARISHAALNFWVDWIRIEN